MKHWSEAEKLFHEEVREKKKTASGVHGKTGKNGYTGKILFPTDFMSRKEKYNHRKAGKILSSNLFEQILPIDEFEKLDSNDQKNRLVYWRNKYTNKEIIKTMKTNNAAYYRIVKELELPKAPKIIDRPARRSGKKVIEVIAPTEAEKPAEVQEVIVNGLHMVYNGSYSAESIQRQLMKFSTLLEGEEDQFYIELKLVQKEKSKAD